MFLFLSKTVCPKNYYGNMCLHRCMCNDAEICDPIRGCICDNSRSSNYLCFIMYNLKMNRVV